MKLQAARSIGEACGLEQDCEHVNNIVLHSLNLFYYPDAQNELRELREDARVNGVRFSSVCGDAIPSDGDELQCCGFCRRMEELTRDKEVVE